MIFACAAQPQLCGPDAPLANLSTEWPLPTISSEAVDAPSWVGTTTEDYGSLPVGGGMPPMDSVFMQTSCLGVCQSTVSQAEANACADAAAVLCIEQGTFPPPTPPGSGWGLEPNPVGTIPQPSAPAQNPLPTFPNTPQSSNYPCPQGETFTATTPAGTYTGFTQAMSNSMASAQASTTALTQNICPGLPLNQLPPIGQMCNYNVNIQIPVSSAAGLPLSYAWSQIIRDNGPPLPLPTVDSGEYVAHVLELGLSATATGFQILNEASLGGAGGFAFPGQYNTLVTATDTNGNQQVIPLNFKVFGLGPTCGQHYNLGGAFYAEPFSEQLTWDGLIDPTKQPLLQIVSGSLAPGLTLNTTPGSPSLGLISGTVGMSQDGHVDAPLTNDGVYQVTIAITDPVSQLVCQYTYTQTIYLVDFCTMDWTGSGWGDGGMNNSHASWGCSAKQPGCMPAGLSATIQWGVTCPPPGTYWQGVMVFTRGQLLYSGPACNIGLNSVPTGTNPQGCSGPNGTPGGPILYESGMTLQTFNLGIPGSGGSVTTAQAAASGGGSVPMPPGNTPAGPSGLIISGNLLISHQSEPNACAFYATIGCGGEEWVLTSG